MEMTFQNRAVKILPSLPINPSYKLPNHRYSSYDASSTGVEVLPTKTYTKTTNGLYATTNMAGT